ncbi:MAG: hypothetical protein QXR05_11920, partial [Candidatus Methanomethylicia archaeon]
HAYEKLSYWYQALSQSYPDAGLQLDLTVKPRKLQEKKTLPNGVEIPERKVENLIKCYWFYPQSISAIYAELAVNLTSHGLYGYVSEGYVALNVTIYTNTIESKHEGGKWYTSFTFHVEKEYGEPVTTLSKENYNFKDPNTLAGWAISFFNPTVKRWQRLSEVDNVAYSAGGNYNVTFKSPWSQNIEFYDNYLILWVRDERGILVEAYSYYLISYDIQERAIPWQSGNSYPYQTYVFELRPSGEILWFFDPIDVKSNIILPPVPPVFVKQLRVFSTFNGSYNMNPMLYTEVPYQVERWESDKYPYQEFEAEKERFGRHERYENRLVFMINYTLNKNIRDDIQRINITWIDDCDTSPPKYYIYIYPEDIAVKDPDTGELITIPSAIISTNIYKLQIVSQPGFSHFIDWSVSFKNNIYHVEYQFHGVGFIGYGNGYWEPHYLPSGSWNMIAGPVRAACFRKSNATEDSPGKNVTSDGFFRNEMVIIIPYNVKYWMLYANITWRKDLANENRYLNLFSIVSGTSDDCGSSYRITNYAYLRENNIVVSGNYYPNTCPNRSGPYTLSEVNDYSYWAAQYRTDFGAALFLSKQALDLVRNLFNSNDKRYKNYIEYIPGNRESKDPDELLIFTSFDYSRRVLYILPHCWCTGGFSECKCKSGGKITNCTVNDKFTIKAGLNYSYKTAAWIYEGGYNEPNIYYAMFKDIRPPEPESERTIPIIQKFIVPGFS